MADFHETHSGANRAAQFMPFAALKGYYELVRQRERIVEPRHEHTPEEVLALSAQLSQLKKGDMVTVRYYDTDAYVTITGMVSEVEPVFGVLTIVRNAIPFSDIYEIECEGKSTADEM